MLGKLLKYEFKATSRTFIPLYIAIIVVSLINGLVFNERTISNVQGIGMLVLGALFTALGVLTIVVTVQRFNKNLLGDEGYLMFTLPVTPKMLIISKTIVSTVWCILSGITAIISFLMIVFTYAIRTSSIKSIDFSLLWDEILNIMAREDFAKDIMYLIGSIGLLIMVYIIFVVTMYLSLSIGQLPMFSKHRKLAPFIAFFIINFVITFIVNKLNYFAGYTMNSGMLIGYLVCIVVILILFFPTSYILEKKLNIE